MGTARLRLTRADQELLREALAYVGRRMFDPRLAAQAGALEDDLDRLLTSSAGEPSGPTGRGRERAPGGGAAGSRPPATLALAPESLRVLRMVLDAYGEELGRPVSAPENRGRVARMRELDRRLARQSGRAGWFWRLRARGR